MDSNNLQDIENYYLGRTLELIEHSKQGDTWFFICTSTFINHLANLVFGCRAGRAEYVEFIEKYMPQTYKNFTYLSGYKDLPLQMWCTLRCGIVHSFSLIPDRRIEPCKSNARDRSIILTHKKNNNGPHLSNYTGIGNNRDAALFVAEDFASDINITTEYIFKEAINNSQLKNNIINWISQFPPIMTEGLLK